MEKKGKRDFSIRAKVAAFWGVAVIALFVVLFFVISHLIGADKTSNEITNQVNTESVEEQEISHFSVTEEIGAQEVLPIEENSKKEETLNFYTDESIIEEENNSDILFKDIIKRDEDYKIIPDRYNCGAKGELQKVGASDMVSGITLKESGGINSFDFYYRNTEIEGTISLSGYDFSDYIVAVYNADNIDREITLVFENCNFYIFRSLSNYPKVNLIFKNCTFNSFYGSCAEFEYCKFGDSFMDGIVPFHDVSVKNSYISNLSSKDTDGTGAHTDGTQIYGKEGIDANNIHFEHCRYEVPCIPGTNMINACIMLQMEFSNGIDITFNDCICNGGGYTIYATKKDKGFKYYENVKISNIQVGQSMKYGSIYPTISENVEVSNLYEIDSLYVASVWKENGKTHLSVTNDTLKDRILAVNADGVNYEYVIPASRGGKTDYYDRFDDYPIDLDICIDEDCRYIVCFDNTLGNYKQIRFETWDESESISIPCEE